MKNQNKISIKMIDSQPGFGGQHGPDYPLPAFNKEFDGEVIQYLSCGERGKFKDYIGIHIVFRSVEIRDKYISAEGMTTKLYAEKFAKVKPLWDELEKIGVFSRDHFTDWVIQ